MARGERGTAKPFRRGDIWWISYSIPGEGQRKESSKSTEKKDALKLLHDRLKEIDQRQIGPKGITVRNLLDLHLRDMKINKRASYKANLGYVENHLSPELGRILADRLSTVRISEFIEKKQGEGLEDGTINRFLETLRHGYHLGRDASPALVHVVPKIRMLTLDNVREGTLEEEDYRRLLGFLPFYLQVFLVVSYHYGWRLREVLNLRWDQVDWASGVIRLERKQTKGKQARVAPIIGEVRSWLERAYLDRREGEETIVSYRAEEHERRPGENTGRPRKAGGVLDQAEAWGVTPKTARRILALGLVGDGLAAVVEIAQRSSSNRRAFLTCTSAARDDVRRALPGVRKAPAAGKPIQSIRTAWETARKLAGVPELLVHDLRRTAVGNMIRAGLSEKESMLIAGHKTTSMHRRYSIVDEGRIVDAGEKMDVWAAGARERAKRKPAAGYRTKLEAGKLVPAAEILDEISEVRTKVRTVGKTGSISKSRKGVYLQ